MKKILSLVCITAVFGSCKKDVGDASSPIIAVTSPSNHQTFTSGQTAAITANITDNDEIHEVHLYVYNKASNAEILHFEEHTDSKTYNLSKSFTIQKGITYKIQVEATDHAENESEVVIEVTRN